MSFNFEEFNEFLNNYNDPNFRSLFEQFTSTAKSPEEKAIFMTEMKNLQRENLKTDAFVSSKKDSAEKKNKYSNVEYFHGFCVKTNATTYRDYGTISIPVFVNICQSNQIKPAIAKKNCAHGEGHAHHHEKLPKNVQDLPNYWKIPHSPPLRVKDINLNQRIYTISFGTQTIVRARKEFPFKQTLIKCAFELIEEEYDEVLDLEYTILDDVAFKHGQSLLESTPSTEFNQDQRDETTNQNQEIAYEIVAEGNVMDETLLSFDKRDFIINELRNQEGQQMACTAKIPFVNLYFSFFFISPMIKFPSFSAIQTKEEVIILIEEILDEASLVGPFLLDRPSSNQTFAQFMCARFRTLSEGCQCHFLFEFESRIGAFKSLITQEKKLLIVLTKDSPCIWLNFNKMT